jgi:peptide/nickel transport system ATP-binding protein
VSTTPAFVPAAAACGPLVLEADGLGKDYRASHGPRSAVLSAVRGVSFGLYRRAVVALVGESGSGKSTVAKLLAGQQRPTRGRILLDGAVVRPSERGSFRPYKRTVQMVFQDPFASLNPVHTVRYHLERPVRLHRQRPGRAALQAELERLLAQVRLAPADHYLPKYPHELSGGQRQRVAIARALAVNPRVLLADEPVSMLDVSIRLEVLDVIDALRRELELAVLYITHDIATARYFADEILVMYAGEIVERGPAEALTQRPAHPYTRLLVASAPDPDAPGGWRPAAEAGGTRAGTAPVAAAGCRFSPRCAFADDRCRAETPPLHATDRERAAACWRLHAVAAALDGTAGEEREQTMKT